MGKTKKAQSSVLIISWKFTKAKLDREIQISFKIGTIKTTARNISTS
jgi:hypothetical protein